MELHGITVTNQTESNGVDQDTITFSIGGLYDSSLFPALPPEFSR